jgi:hypothetical protein
MHTKKGFIKPLIEKDLLLAFGKRGGLFTIFLALITHFVCSTNTNKKFHKTSPSHWQRDHGLLIPNFIKERKTPKKKGKG